VQDNEKRWFSVRAAVTYETLDFVQAATREDALKVYWTLGDDELDSGDVMDVELVEVEECAPPGERTR
jgi:hypothetical protein